MCLQSTCIGGLDEVTQAPTLNIKGLNGEVKAQRVDYLQTLYHISLNGRHNKQGCLLHLIH